MPRDPNGVGDSPDSFQLSEARWQGLLSTLQDAVISIDASGRINLFNRAAERIFGYSADEVLGRDVRMLMPHPYSDEHAAYVEHYRKTGIRKAIGQIRNVHALRKDGTIFPIELSVSEARVGNDNVFMAIIRDVSERYASADALGVSEARYQAIVQAAVDGMVTIDEHGIIASFNAAAARMFGYTPDEVIGQNVKILMPSPYHDEHDGYLRNYLTTGVKKIIGIGREVVGRRKDGSVFPMNLSVGEVRFHDKLLFTGLIQDITERVQTAGKLRAMEREVLERQRLADIGAITAQIVHDLGNPLAAISMQAQLIVRRARRDPTQSLESVLKPAELVVERVKHLDALVREFLEFAREQRVNLITIDLHRLLFETVGLWEGVAADLGIELALESTAADLRVKADEEKLRRVFDNLIKNALEAIERGPGSIRIRAAPHDAHIRISISDTGPGIPKNVDAFRLFETTKPNGTGLGLPIARQILVAHGGGIEVAPAQPHGAVFHVDLPR